MKIPEIQGRNKIRDAAIVMAFKIERMEYAEIAVKFKLSQRRIFQILSKNHAYIKVDKEWERQKRIFRLERYLRNADGTKKDALDILEQLRKEIDGEEKQNTNIQINNYPDRTFVFRDLKNDNETEEHTRDIPADQGAEGSQR